jgi:hypothetical protein
MACTDQPSCPPSLGAALLSARLVRSRSTLGGGCPPGILRTGVSARSALGRPVANLHYYAGSDSCQRSPAPTGLPVYFALPSDRSAPNHVMRTSVVCSRQSQRRRRLSGFATRSQARRNTPPNRVRQPTDRSFASGYSPPRLATTQLPSATGPWHTRTRTYTVLTMRPHGRTSVDLQVNTATERDALAKSRPGGRRSGPATAGTATARQALGCGAHETGLPSLSLS